MGLRKLLKPVLNRILPRFARWYLRKERSYRYEDLLVQVPPGVFHPGLYNSTKHLLAHLKQFDLQGKILLEIGAGSGLISIWCARQGAVVTATDLSEAAISAIQGNAAQNQVSLEVVHSDLFQGLTPRIFDFILLNPPFFKGTAQNEEAHAWYAGPEFEYFQRLFEGLKSYRKPGSILRMILSEDCALEEIRSIAQREDWAMEVVETVRSWGEWVYIYELRFRGVG